MRVETRDGFEFEPMHYPFNQKQAIRIVTGNHTIQEYQEYINENGIEYANIVMPNLQILRACPTLKHLRICPSDDSAAGFDFTPLYEVPEIVSLNCQNQYGNRQQYIGKIDYSLIRGLKELHVHANRGALNYNKVGTLKSFSIGGTQKVNRDITDLFCSEILDTFTLHECGILSLNGVEKSRQLQCLYLYYNRSLQDISALKKVKGTLRALRIANCPRINDFSVLGELENVELLELSGSNELPDLSFLKQMKSLKTFVFSMNVKDGDLTPCLNLSYVYSEKNRKHYNLKDKELPKAQYVRGNENIEEWRRLE